MATPEEHAKALNESQQVSLNLQSALGELEQQLKWMSNRCASVSVERDNAIRYAKQLEDQIKAYDEQIRMLLERQQAAATAAEAAAKNAEAELVPISETKKVRKPVAAH